MSDPQDLIYQGSGISVPSPQLFARVQWAITHADGQQAVLTWGPSLPPDTGFGTNVSLLMAVQQCEPVQRRLLLSGRRRWLCPIDRWNMSERLKFARWRMEWMNHLLHPQLPLVEVRVTSV